MIDRITEQPFRQTRVMCRAVDNLELLLSQPDESVDLIYCDILYGTGRNFGDYQDLKPIRSEIEAHYLPRLKEMHRVLKQNGSIYLQMDYRISHWIRLIMDDIFGYDNFVNEIIWCYTKKLEMQKDIMQQNIFYVLRGLQPTQIVNRITMKDKSKLHDCTVTNNDTDHKQLEINTTLYGDSVIDYSNIESISFKSK